MSEFVTYPAFWDAGHRAYDQPQITSSSEIEHGHQAVVDRPELLRRDVADAISKTVHVYCSDLLHENASL